MTATEAALYDQVVSGDLRYWMGSLTHQNSPARYLSGGSRPQVSRLVGQHHQQGQQ